MLADKVYLVGFMCSGKSTVAASLANRLGWQVHDIDTLIEKREGMSIAEIFSQHGELYFRSVERDILSEVVAFRDAVVATGGGTYVDDANRQIIDKDGVSRQRAGLRMNRVSRFLTGFRNGVRVEVSRFLTNRSKSALYYTYFS